jgi:hypothetical protein
LSSIRKNAFLAAVAAAALTTAIVAPAGASHRAHRCDGSGGVGPKAGKARRCADPLYVNPIRAKRWYAGRTDMGVDYVPTDRPVPVLAIGDAKILGSDRHSGWPGGHYMWYRLLDGDHAGNIVYVAEELRGMAHKGTVVSAGDQIAIARARGTGTEWGWATKSGSPRAGSCYHEGQRTNSGKQMARFLRSLGADTADKPGPGPDYPSGPPC